jgi:hypothetical protein
MNDSSNAAAPISRWTIFNILIGSRYDGSQGRAEGGRFASEQK